MTMGSVSVFIVKAFGEKMRASDLINLRDEIMCSFRFMFKNIR